MYYYSLVFLLKKKLIIHTNNKEPARLKIILNIVEKKLAKEKTSKKKYTK